MVNAVCRCTLCHTKLKQDDSRPVVKPVSETESASGGQSLVLWPSVQRHIAWSITREVHQPTMMAQRFRHLPNWCSGLNLKKTSLVHPSFWYRITNGILISACKIYIANQLPCCKIKLCRLNCKQFLCFSNCSPQKSDLRTDVLCTTSDIR